MAELRAMALDWAKAEDLKSEHAVQYYFTQTDFSFQRSTSGWEWQPRVAYSTLLEGTQSRRHMFFVTTPDQSLHLAKKGNNGRPSRFV